MSTEPNPIRWAIKEAEESTRYLAHKIGGQPVTADWEGKLAKAHKACDRAELVEQEHAALRLSLHAMIKLTDQLHDPVLGRCVDHITTQEARRVLAALSAP